MAKSSTCQMMGADRGRGTAGLSTLRYALIAAARDFVACSAARLHLADAALDSPTLSAPRATRSLPGGAEEKKRAQSPGRAEPFRKGERRNRRDLQTLSLIWTGLGAGHPAETKKRVAARPFPGWCHRLPSRAASNMATMFSGGTLAMMLWTC